MTDFGTAGRLRTLQYPAARAVIAGLIESGGGTGPEKPRQPAERELEHEPERELCDRCQLPRRETPRDEPDQHPSLSPPRGP